MKTLIYGAGPIGRWLALRMHQAGQDVTLLARSGTYRKLVARGIVIVDGLTGKRLTARPKMVDRLEPDDLYDLVVVAMQKSSRMAVCPTLAENDSLRNILFMGNDVSGFQHYVDYLPKDRILLGFPGLGGGWEGDDLVIMDREKRGCPLGEIFGSRSAEIRFGLHARTVGPELIELAEEFAVLKRLAGLETPSLDALLAHVPRQPATDRMKVAS